MPNAICSTDLFEKWVKAIGLPDNCRRMVIDLHLEDVVNVYYECIGDERFLDIEPPCEALKTSVMDIGGDADAARWLRQLAVIKENQDEPTD